MPAKPPRIPSYAQHWHPNTKQDPARYLVDPGKVEREGQSTKITYTAGMLGHARPFLINGGRLFIWPIGVEGFRRTGQATLGIHHYMGDDYVDVQVIHRDESRLELSGTFPGLTSVQNMLEMIDVITADTNEPGMILYMPGIFEREQYLNMDNYEFSHPEDDRTHSITYSVTFVRTGVGNRVPDPDPQSVAGGVNPAEGEKKGETERFFMVRDGVRTLKAISSYVYNDVDLWTQIYDLNKNRIDDLLWQNLHITDMPLWNVALYIWPVGTQFAY